MGRITKKQNNECWGNHLQEKVQIQRRQRKANKSWARNETASLQGSHWRDAENWRTIENIERLKLLPSDHICWTITNRQIFQTWH